MKQVFFIIFFGSVFGVFAEGFPIEKNTSKDNDSTSLVSISYDIPFLSYCDSLYASSMTINEDPKPWLSYYDFDIDSVPTYLDTTYQERIKRMDIRSPFSFRYNADVRKMIYFYGNRRPKMISKALAKKELYFPLFEEMLDKYQLPQELKYLAIVESALNSKARSHAGAVGLWQFMPATGRMYGLHSNSRIDDRMNPYKATEAACQYFVDLYQIYQDWNLVLASYNAGPGNVNKAIRRSGGATDFWTIQQYLPRETRAYVPAFIAVNYFMNYPEAHNIEARQGSQISYYETDTIYIQKEISFNQIADWLDIDVAVVKELNPQYRRHYIPKASSQKRLLRLPIDKIGMFILNEDLILSGITKKKIYSLERNNTVSN